MIGERTFGDTQIFKEWVNGKKCVISQEEWYEIEKTARDGIWSNGYRYNDDDANGYIAFSFCKVDQKSDPTWGDDLVDRLNEICEKQGTEPSWYLGDEEEEYVFTD